MAEGFRKVKPSGVSSIKVEGHRLARDIEEIAAFTEVDPQIGFSRPTFSPSWRRARDYVAEEARKAGCDVRIDAAGNLHARPSGLGWQEKVWLCGSHVDSVPTGGRFDGVTGVVVALEVLRAAPDAPMELIVFAEEEGTTFNLGMLGSRAWAGMSGADQLRTLRNRGGMDYLAAGAAHGVDPARLETERFDPSAYRGLIEAHVEQGPALWNAGVPVAVVTAIAGRRQYSCALTGEANHAGATAMADRRDALTGAAQVVVALEALGRAQARTAGHTVVTVGRLEVQPNAVNVIPGRVSFTIDFRARSNEALADGDLQVRKLVQEIARSRELALELSCTEELPAVPLDPGVCERLREAAWRLELELPETVSGALHDTAILAPLLPAAMLFIASRGGISHNPGEFSRIDDIACAARIVAEAVCR
jgi:hydantoinase/carbamoylase family amidase